MQGAGTLFARWEGSKEGQRRCAPVFGLDKIVSMKWSGVLGAGTLPKSMGAGRAKSPCEWGSGERDSSDDPWFGAGGEGLLQALRVMER